MLAIEYHYIGKEIELGNLPHHSEEEFENHLRKLKDKRSPLNFNDFLGRLENGEPYPESCFIPTFDDSLRPTVSSVLPILKQQSVQGCFFIYTEALVNPKLVPTLEKQRILQYFDRDYSIFLNEFCKTSLKKYPSLPRRDFDLEAGEISEKSKEYYPEFTFYSPMERYYRMLRGLHFNEEMLTEIFNEMFAERFDEEEWANFINITPSDIRNILNDGHVIGCHTHTHPIDMKSLPVDQQRWEIKESLSILEEITGKDIVSFAYPTNSFNEQTVEVLKEFNIVCAFKAEREVNSKFDYFRIPRCDSALLDI